MSAIAGTRRALKELADGTLRVQIDIDPRFKAQFHELFPQIDMPVALAPLASDFERIEHKEEEKPKGRALAKLAGMWCSDPEFRWWFVGHEERHATEEEAAQQIRDKCGIQSRAELDGNEDAAELFNRMIRIPYMDWLKTKPHVKDNRICPR